MTSKELEVAFEAVEPGDSNNESDSLVMEVDSSQTKFLNAQTRGFPHARPTTPHICASDLDWEEYVVTGAADYGLLMQGVQKGFPSGRHKSVICTDLVKIFSNSETYTEFLSHRGDIAQGFVDILQMLLDQRDDPFEPRLRAILYVALVRLCRKSELYPRAFSLTNVEVKIDGNPHSCGRFGDVYRGKHKDQDICVKVVRTSQTSDPVSLHKAFAREAVVWGQLSHSNILPFIGIYRFGENNERFSLVSSWMCNGNVNDFLQPRSQHDRTSLAFGVASGMQYLHENGVVHGDLKCLNILVTQDEQACLADFGHSFVTDANGLQDLSSALIIGGTTGFLAPELIDPNGEENVRRTEASDVFAYGMMFAGKPLFGNATPIAINFKIINAQRPGRPNKSVHLKRGLTDNMWDLIESCWADSPSQRPTAAQIVARLQPMIAVNHRPGFDTKMGNKEEEVSQMQKVLQKEKKLRKREEEVQRREEEVKRREEVRCKGVAVSEEVQLRIKAEETRQKEAREKALREREENWLKEQEMLQREQELRKREEELERREEEIAAPEAERTEEEEEVSRREAERLQRQFDEDDARRQEEQKKMEERFRYEQKQEEFRRREQEIRQRKWADLEPDHAWKESLRRRIEAQLSPLLTEVKRKFHEYDQAMDHLSTLLHENYEDELERERQARLTGVPPLPDAHPSSGPVPSSPRDTISLPPMSDAEVAREVERMNKMRQERVRQREIELLWKQRQENERVRREKEKEREEKEEAERREREDEERREREDAEIRQRDDAERTPSHPARVY
ncbi:hypothetical protein H0H92_009600 [Tricholoma furcatifolium]|nr:hypothetical protein H0H92_009600 [Tricholoma furcatifolium]